MEVTEIYKLTLGIIGAFGTAYLAYYGLKIIIDRFDDLLIGYRKNNELKLARALNERRFDDKAEFFVVPNDTRIGIRLFKNGKAYYEATVQKLNEPKSTFFNPPNPLTK